MVPNCSRVGMLNVGGVNSRVIAYAATSGCLNVAVVCRACHGDVNCYQNTLIFVFGVILGVDDRP